jgi:hypothetical protein
MKFSLNLLIAAFLFSNSAYSQCTPDYDYFPLISNFGLSPDSLPSGTVFQQYNQDLTFVLPLDTLYDVPNFGETLITFEDYHIQSISLPPGLEWECNSSENDCHYNPSDSQYGCVTINGTPILAGLYDVEVFVEATHELSYLVGTEIITFTLPLYIEPSASQNDGFSMTNFSGCVPLSVEFENNNPNLASYFWDFGNGVTSNMENPEAQVFYNPGVFIVNYTSYLTSESSFTLESLTINGSDNWYDWSDDGTSFTPDHYFYILNQNQNIIYSSYIQDNEDLPSQFNDVGLILEDQTYYIQVWDDDTYFNFAGLELGTDDNLGTLDFDFNSTNISAGGLSISFTISETLPIIYDQVTDTIYVYENPIAPILSYDEPSNLLYVDSEIEDLSFQWYFNQEPLVGENTSTMEVVESGNYMIEFVNNYGCNTFSVDTFIVFCDNDYSPQVSIDGPLLSVDNFLEYNCQWFFNGMELSGENQDQLIATQSGEYSVLLFDEQGCEYKSQNVNIDLSTILELSGINIILYPNPANSYVELSLDNINSSDVLISIFDLQGRNVFNDLFNSSKFQIDISSLQKGTYIVNVQIESARKSMRLLVN